MSRVSLDFVSTGELDIACRDLGLGPPMILLHGAEGDHRVYDPLQDALAVRHRVVSFDQRDCGKTRFRGPEPDAYSLTDVAWDAIAILDALGLDKAVFVGFSLGGLLAQIIASTWPERVDRLVLGLTWPGNLSLQDLHPEGRERRALLRQQGAERELAELMSTPEFVAARPEIVDELRDLTTMPSEAARARRFGAVTRAEPVALARIVQPTLVLAAERDQMVPPEVTANLAAALPNARFGMVPNVGHLATRQAPDLVAGMIGEFLHVE